MTYVSCTIHIYAQHTFYDDGEVSAGLSRYPISPGQTYVMTAGLVPIMEFTRYMSKVKCLSQALCHVIGLRCCDPVPRGSHILP